MLAAKLNVPFLWLGTFIFLTAAAASQTASVQNTAITITLDQAIARATVNEPAFTSVRANKDISLLERTSARAAMLPTVTYHNEAIYTEPNGVPSSRIGQVSDAPAPVFIANNAVREYASQGVFNETLGLGQVAAIHLADANAARSAAELEIARRGLVSTVVSLYYGVGSSGSKTAIANEAKQVADRFVEITQEREAQREAAHADVLKAQLVQQQRERDLRDAKIAAVKARLELAVLLFPDPATQFDVVSANPGVLPERSVVESLARKNNPELRSAAASVQVSQAGTLASQAALLPQLNLNFTYGIDATNFAVNGPEGIHNLGYAFSAQLDIPVWDWLTTERKIKGSRLQETAAKAALTNAQRRAVANLQEFYAEAEAANQQLASLDTSVATARESLRLTELRYVNGESSVLEVVDAQSTLTAAQNEQIDGNTRYQLALANLQTLTGTL